MNNELVLKNWKNALEIKNEAIGNSFASYNKPDYQKHSPLLSSSNYIRGSHLNSTKFASRHPNGKNISNSDLRLYLRSLDEKLIKHEIVNGNQSFNDNGSFQNSILLSPINQNKNKPENKYNFQPPKNDEIFCMICENFFFEKDLQSHFPQCKGNKFTTVHEKFQFYDYKLNEIVTRLENFLEGMYGNDINYEFISSISNEIKLAFQNKSNISCLMKNISQIEIFSSKLTPKSNFLSILTYSNASIKFIHDKIECIKEMATFGMDDKVIIHSEVKNIFNKIMHERFRNSINDVANQILHQKIPLSQWESLLKNKINFLDNFLLIF